MFEWLHPHHDSPDLEHAKKRQQERDLAHTHADPLAEYEVLDTTNMVVEELPAEEAKRVEQTLTSSDDGKSPS